MRAEQEGLSPCSFTEERAGSQSFYPKAIYTRLGAATSLTGAQQGQKGNWPQPPVPAPSAPVRTPLHLTVPQGTSQRRGPLTHTPGTKVPLVEPGQSTQHQAQRYSPGCRPAWKGLHRNLNSPSPTLTPTHLCKRPSVPQTAGRTSPSSLCSQDLVQGLLQEAGSPGRPAEFR